MNNLENPGPPINWDSLDVKAVGLGRLHGGSATLSSQTNEDISS